MKCPKCGNRTKVVDSRERVEGTVNRIRHCKKCGFRYVTVEKFLSELGDSRR